MDPIIAAFCGYLAGCVFRTLYDYLFKLLETEDISFDPKYLTTMIIALILSVMTAMVTFSGYTWPSGDQASLFFSAVTTGFTLNHIVNKPIGYLVKKARR